MSKYFEVLVFGHVLSQDVFSCRAIRFADVSAIVIISCAFLCISKFYLSAEAWGKGSVAGRMARSVATTLSSLSERGW
jgi:hypothetical protein